MAIIQFPYGNPECVESLAQLSASDIPEDSMQDFFLWQ
jgi:hypothetical protein